MKILDLICNKFQSILGSNYLIYSDTFFNDNFTEAREVRTNTNDLGYEVLANNSYLNLRKNKIIGILSLDNATQENADNFYMSSTYNIDFSVPVNASIKHPFYADIDSLITSTLNQKITLDTTYYSKMTVSKPKYIGIEKDGELTYKIMRVSGTISVTDKYLFGSDYSISLYIGSEYVAINGINNLSVEFNATGNSIPIYNTTKTQQNLAQTGWNISFNIDDFTSTNTARNFIYNIVHKNNEILNSSGSTDYGKRRIKVKYISPYYATGYEFYGFLTVHFSTERNGVGNYAVGITNTNKVV